MPDALPAEPQRIVIVTTELGMGGAERCVANLASRLNREKYQVQVVALATPPEPPRDGLVRQLHEAGVPLTFLNCRRSWQFFSATRQLRRIVQDTQPAVLWSFLFHANVVATLAARGLPVRRLQALRVIEQGRWRRKLQAWVAAKADRVLCVSEGVRQFAETTLGISPEKLAVIANGIDVAAIEPTIYSAPIDRKMRMIAVGRLDPQKDYPTMLQSVSWQLRNHDDWELVIVGNGPERSSLETLVHTLGVSGRVRLVGWQPDIQTWLQDSEIYLLTSRWEGMPNALIEAMAHGLPVVTTDVEGVAELLPGSLGRQVATRQEFLDRRTILDDLMENPSLRQQFGQVNRVQIQEHFSLQQMVQQYEALLDDLLSSKNMQR
ncbi:glycosyltransferase [Blastopirellula marina]|nr:glycosyltransferase [Blastopirellula marina]